mmetsp:Transcript_51424/g.171645  ORF Transcript_51424/g.171645 Transcript_51424/m.171645 type:complete len:238 (-) Transcript_51424:101-814(-)
MPCDGRLADGESFGHETGSLQSPYSFDSIPPSRAGSSKVASCRCDITCATASMLSVLNSAPSATSGIPEATALAASSRMSFQTSEPLPACMCRSALASVLSAVEESSRSPKAAAAVRSTAVKFQRSASSHTSRSVSVFALAAPSEVCTHRDTYRKASAPASVRTMPSRPSAVCSENMPEKTSEDSMSVCLIAGTLVPSLDSSTTSEPNASDASLSFSSLSLAMCASTLLTQASNFAC